MFINSYIQYKNTELRDHFVIYCNKPDNFIGIDYMLINKKELIFTL